MRRGNRFKVVLKNGEIKYHILPFGLRESEIYGHFNDKYGSDVVDYELIED